MKYGSMIAFTIAFFLMLTACKKNELANPDCDHLRQGLQAKDIHLISESIRHSLTTYSKENLDQLAATISDRCGMATKVLCFDCIYTLPGQSEIKCSFSQSGTSIERIVDVSYNQQNEMTIVRVHD